MDEIFTKVKEHKLITPDESFVLSKLVSNLIVNEDTRNKGIEIIIYTIDNWGKMPIETQEIWVDIIESVGFYPYLEKLQINANTDLGYKIRKESHYSNNIHKYFHEQQEQLANLIFSGKNVLASAPTSFGKSLLIEEIVASKKYKNIVIIQPTLALLDETRRKLNKYKNEYKLIVRTSQEFDANHNNIFLLTAERVLEYPDLPNIDMLILDEFYKLSNLRGDNRSSILNNAFLKVMRNRACQFYLLGPTVNDVSPEFLKRYNAVFFKKDYSLVLTEEINCQKNVTTMQGRVLEEDLFQVLDRMDDQTIIFCSSPSRARKLAFLYAKHIEEFLNNAELIKLPLIDWIKSNINWQWSLIKSLEYGIGVHDGAMPKHITSSTIKYFNERKIKYLFCTNTIIEGVNTSAKNVIYYDDKIGKKDIDFFDYANIRGRAGRLMEHYIGRIINLKTPPKEESVVIDIPIIDQNPIENEVLVNLDENDIKDINDNKYRYKKFNELEPELQAILKKNAVSIDGQLNILKRLEKDVSNADGYALISWKEIDKSLHEHIKYILDLCWENLSTESERKSFGSKKDVCGRIVGICYQKTIGEFIDERINYKLKQLAKENKISDLSITSICKDFPLESQGIIDNVIEGAFGFQKNWQSYRAPKWINVVDSLQKYVCKKLGVESGDYSYVSEKIENNFVDPEFQILLEFGLPENAVKTIQQVSKQLSLTSEITEDNLLTILKNNFMFYENYLSKYEIDILMDVL